MSIRRPLTCAAVASGLLLATTLPASAHPFFADGATVAASSLDSASLSMAHGCGTEADSGGDPTLEVALEVPEQVSFIEATAPDGYELDEEGDGPVPDTIVWTATDGGETAPVFDLDLVVDGDEGDEVLFRVFQGCDDFQYRWIGTPDDPSDDPAVGMTLGAEDPDSPAPEPEPGREEVPDEGSETDETDEPVDPANDPADEEPTAVEDLPTEPAGDEGVGFGWLPVVVGAVVLAGLGALLAGRRRALDPAASPGDDAGPPPTA